MYNGKEKLRVKIIINCKNIKINNFVISMGRKISFRKEYI